jgi:hypothetical protein
MSFEYLAETHRRIDDARNFALKAREELEKSANQAALAGNLALWRALLAIEHQLLALDFLIPPPQR